jgi:hypothetical protein
MTLKVEPASKASIRTNILPSSLDSVLRKIHEELFKDTVFTELYLVLHEVFYPSL